ncbi:MAG: ribosome biogenesis GTPase Der [Proteobacteria bacterium]|nr:MAG: ribosome biogenesis GTPase Der [Pseudomonadota bacterium]
MNERPLAPLIAIVGRPNVGKSTLFNRFAGRRRALVDDLPGLTRDRIVEAVEVAGRRVLVVDTAGFEPAPTGSLGAAVQAQARAAVRDADAILFVVDGQAGLLPEDDTIARELRRSDRPIALLVNKIDTLKHEARAAEFHRLGFERVRAISAEHGRGAWDALEEIVAALPEAAAHGSALAADVPDAIRIAVVGRPNVGKSSLVNRLLGEERMVVSDEGGTTRDAVDSVLEGPGGPYVLVDTAGIRRRGRRDRIGERTSALQAIRSLERADVALVVTDASEGFTDQDANVLGVARESGCATGILLNKWDTVAKLPASDRERLREGVAMRTRFAADVPQLAISAKSGSRVDKVLPLARELAESGRRRIATAELNRWLADVTHAHEPAMAQRGARKRPLRFLYATQTGVRPPSFVIFCSDPSGVRASYRRYLENRLRERFELQGTPIRITLRGRREKSRGARPSGGAS